jgi:hypothetical protein
MSNCTIYFFVFSCLYLTVFFSPFIPTSIFKSHTTSAYEAYSNEGEDKHIFVASQTAVSFLRKYYDATLEHIFPHLTAIIDVEDGVSYLIISFPRIIFLCHV